MQDYEKLGTFYLGREYDMDGGKPTENLLLYDARDLVTHAVAVGMTGSGKTGLCIGLIEEAAIDGVPSILIDPKGDLTNLMLTFPELRSEDFRPWINIEDATRKGLSADEFASQQAEMWKKGLADWHQDGARIQRLRDASEVVIYTPGSTAGVPVSILKSFAAPPPEILEDSELFQERISSTVTSLLGLLNIQADPLQSREHILISSILGQMWQNGQDLDLAALIASVQKPPVSQIGVLDVETFYPSKDRFGLVMALNNLLASPGFSTWMDGVPLDIKQILYTGQGKPRVAIFSIAHLSDSERMFFVSMLLNQVLGWMRTLPGTTSLRTLLYMDEIFGYFPPTANPPSKKPLLTLLKQARAYGVGVVLATQNPVDLDYKGLSNTGTWFIGRLQTERDKARVMEGLEGAAASAGSGFDRQRMNQLLAGLGSRVFLMNNTHEDEPVVFNTRWCMSYLRGPLTRTQIKDLMDPYKAQNGQSVSAVSPVAAAGVAAVTAAQPSQLESSIGAQPTLAADVPQFFIPVRGNPAGLVYRPMLVGGARVRFSDTRRKIDDAREVVALTSVHNQVIPVNWEEAREVDLSLNDLEKMPVAGMSFEGLPSAASSARSYTGWTRDFSSWLFGNQSLELFRSPSLGEISSPGEDERDFRVRLAQVAREHRDLQVENLRKKYASRINTLQERVRRAEQAVQREVDQASQSKVQTALSVGATLLGAFTGRKVVSATNINKAASALKNVGRSAQQHSDVSRAKETVDAHKKQLDELNAEFEREAEALESKIDPATETFETILIKPKKTDIEIRLVALAWAPYRVSNGEASPAW